MAVKFLEPGGDADFGIGLWNTESGAPAIVTDFVHGTHIKSIQYRPNAAADTLSTLEFGSLVADAGGRVSIYVYFVALPSATATLFGIEKTGGTGVVARIRMTSAGVLQLWDSAAQKGSNGSTLSTGVWYRLSFAWTIASSTVNELRLFKDSISDISVTNTTLTNVTSADFFIGNGSGNTSLDYRSSDHYIDDSTALTDPGNIWVTAKRPNANGTTNGYTTQIGAGGSGYGSGHSPQVNERANSDVNGWSVVSVASAITEEYNIESVSQGDIDITGATIVDYMGWLRTKALNAETGQIIVNNVNSNISITTAIKFFIKVAGSSSYPAGTGTDIGEISAAIATTISLYECGIIVAYIPGAVVAGPSNQGYFQRMGFFG